VWWKRFGCYTKSEVDTLTLAVLSIVFHENNIILFFIVYIISWEWLSLESMTGRLPGKETRSG
jgi:hypothetical protein